MTSAPSPHAIPGTHRREGARSAWLERRDGTLTFHLTAPSEDVLWNDFEGTVDRTEGEATGTGPTSARNANLLRTVFANLKPVPLGLATSAGFGDRLGLATPGHARALRTADPSGTIQPIFAQQSIREMTRTHRTAQGVMDDATWGTFQAGWTTSVGADADHLKTEADVRTCVDAGFTFFTFDPGDRVDDDAAHDDAATLDAKLAALPWDALQSSQTDLLHHYRDRTLDLGNVKITLGEEAIVRAAVKYGAALAHAAHLHQVLVSTGAPHEIEVSVDETGTPTTLEEHAFLALELARLEIPVVSLAPRFVGRFEKGVDFRGDLDELVTTLTGHAAIARELGPYKLSLHSGSDKFSVYPHIAEATQGRVHLKTAGTSYLEALRVTARHDPALFREILTIAHDRFETDRASYLIGADPSRVPTADAIDDAALPGLLDDDDARQLLHVTFGSALDAIRPRLLSLLETHHEDHEVALEAHFVRHLTPFAKYARSDENGDTP